MPISPPPPRPIPRLPGSRSGPCLAGDRGLAVTFRLTLTLALAIAIAILGLPPTLRAQTPEQQTAFDAATRALRDGFAAKAADDFAAFRQRFPESPLTPEAGLREARARAELNDLDTAAQLLTDRIEALGSLKDQALHLLGDIHLRRGRFSESAQAFARLLRETPESALLLPASFGEALATFRAGGFAQAVALLSGPTNAFVRASTAAPNDDLAFRGHLLLADAQIRSGATTAAQQTLDSLTNRPLTPTQGWDREWLVTSLALTNAQLPRALGVGSQLVTLATTAASRELLARSHAVRGEIFRRQNLPAESFNALTNNLAEGVPVEWRRDALLALTELTLPPPQWEPAARLISALTNAPPADAVGSASRLAVAELRLQRIFAEADHASLPPAATNALAETQGLLRIVVSNAPTPVIAGRAWYGLGWTELVQRQARPAADAFARAAGVLPPSRLKALALFKLADCQVVATNYAAAVTNYLEVIRSAGTAEGVREGVLERALYQGALAALEAGQGPLANELAGRAVVEFPNGEFRDDARMVYGQTLARLDPPGRAREVLAQLAARLVLSPELPDIRLAVARSYVREGSWTNALQLLDEWTQSYPTHPRLVRAEFERSWAAFKTGNEPRAYQLFTNFLSRFRDDPATPQAQFWVGDHLYRNGDYFGAEGSYQLVFQRTNNLLPRLSHEARLMAGRAAFARQGYRDAKGYFRWIITNGPPVITNSLISTTLVARAYFALGDCFVAEPEGDTPLGDAMNAFVAVIDRFPDTREALLARGKLATCHLSRAELDPNQAPAAYTNAARLYLDVLQAASADLTTRSQAEVELGLLREKQASRATGAERDQAFKEALSHFLNVFHGQNLRATSAEAASPFWMHRAGLEAARLAEALGLREQAANVYERLAETFPASANGFRQRIAQLRGRDSGAAP